MAEELKQTASGGPGEGQLKTGVDFLSRALKMFFGILVAFIIVSLGWFLIFGGSFIVDTTTESVIVLQFGKFKQECKEGWHWFLPSPVNRIVRIPINKQEITSLAFMPMDAEFLYYQGVKADGTGPSEVNEKLVPGVDGYVLLGILPKLWHDQTGGVFLARAAAGSKQYTPGISGCVKLSRAGQTFPVFTRFPEFHKLLRGGSAEPLFDRIAAAAPILGSDGRTKLSAVEHTAELQPVGNVDIDLDVRSHALPLRPALVIGAEGQVNLAVTEGVRKALHKAVLRVDPRDLVTIPVVCHVTSPSSFLVSWIISRRAVLFRSNWDMKSSPVS
jgi:hypothetical protein